MLPYDYSTLKTLAGPLHYRWIPQDYGGTYKHTTNPPPDIEDLRPFALPAIGTWQCRTCVGVYMKLSPTLCFVAHINAAHMRPNWDRSRSAIDPYANRIVTEAEGAYVRDEVRYRLEKESRRWDWPPVEKIMELTLVCPMLCYEGKDLSGKYIVQGIKDFLHRPHVIVEKSEGFVVQFSSGFVTHFPVQKTGDKRKSPLPDDGVNYVGHIFHGGDQQPNWFIDIGELWQPRRFLGGSEDVVEVGEDGRSRVLRRRRRWSV